MALPKVLNEPMAPARESQVSSVLNVLASNAEELNTLLNTLEDKLRPVMTNYPEEGKSVEEKPTLVPVASAIYQINLKLERCMSTVHYILTSLEL